MVLQIAKSIVTVVKRAASQIYAYSFIHFSDVIMSAMASQITGGSIACSIVVSGADQRTQQTPRYFLALCAGNSPVTGEFPTQKAGKTENVSIWWRHLDISRECTSSMGASSNGLNLSDDRLYLPGSPRHWAGWAQYVATKNNNVSFKMPIHYWTIMCGRITWWTFLTGKQETVAI